MTEIKIPEHLQHQFDRAKEELGEETYHKHLDVKFGKPVLNFARSMVINLPGDCFANCWYCIDGSLRRQVVDFETFLKRCEETFQESFLIFMKLLSLVEVCHQRNLTILSVKFVTTTLQ